MRRRWTPNAVLDDVLDDVVDGVVDDVVDDASGRRRHPLRQ